MNGIVKQAATEMAPFYDLYSKLDSKLEQEQRTLSILLERMNLRRWSSGVVMEDNSTGMRDGKEPEVE